MVQNWESFHAGRLFIFLKWSLLEVDTEVERLFQNNISHLGILCQLDKNTNRLQVILEVAGFPSFHVSDKIA